MLKNKKSQKQIQIKLFADELHNLKPYLQRKLIDTKACTYLQG